MYSESARISLSPEEIRAFIIQRLKAALPGLPLEPCRGEPYRLTLMHPDAGEMVLNLGNLVQEVRGATPHDAKRLVDIFVSLAQRAVAGPKIAFDKVYPGLRNRTFMEETGQSSNDPLVGDGPGDLVSVVLADQGEGIALLTESAVRHAGHSTEDVLLAAERNLVGLLPKTFGEMTGHGAVLSLGVQDHPWLGTSLLFVPTIISNAMEQLGWSRVMLAAPTRESVDLVDASRRDAAEVMERWMNECLAGPRTQSEVVFTYDLHGTEYRKTHRMAGDDLVRLN